MSENKTRCIETHKEKNSEKDGNSVNTKRSQNKASVIKIYPLNIKERGVAGQLHK